MWKVILLGVAGLAVILFGFSLVDVNSGGAVDASARLLDSGGDSGGYARAIGPYDWHFPADYGPHPDFQTEWWYYTGNLSDDSGRRFGFQFTIFRRAIAPGVAASNSEWRTNQVYMAHFTVSDIAGGNFYHEQRFSRGSADLAGATAHPRYRVWLEDWQIVALNDDATQTQITAAADEMAVDLTLRQVKPPALQGEGGLSQKSDTPGNASYYYSLTRLISTGTISIGGETFAVSGLTWKDHEFSTSALGADAQGWDWFGLIFEDDTELMLGQIRLVEGGKDPAFGGLYVREDGSTLRLGSEDITITASDTWQSPHTGAGYPAGWTFRVAIGADEALTFTAAPLLADQELTGGIAYWEGAVRIEGDVTGYGYAELTGYVGTMNGRF